MSKKKKSRKSRSRCAKGSAHQKNFCRASQACMSSRPGSWSGFGACMRSKLKSRRLNWAK